MFCSCQVHSAEKNPLHEFLSIRYLEMAAAKICFRKVGLLN